MSKKHIFIAKIGLFHGLFYRQVNVVKMRQDFKKLLDFIETGNYKIQFS
jgi:hypothetical protein